MRTVAQLVVLGVLLAGGPPGVSQDKKDINLTLLGLKKGSDAGQFVVVQGQVKGIPEGTIIGHAVWPKGDIFYTGRHVTRVGKGGKVEIKAQIGRVGNIDVGKEFAIYAYAFELGQKPPVFDEKNPVNNELDFLEKLIPHVYQKNPKAISVGLTVTRKK